MNEYIPNKLSNILFIIAAFIFLFLVIGIFIWGDVKSKPPDHVDIEVWRKWKIASSVLVYIGAFSILGGLVTQYILKRKKGRERNDIKIK